MEFLSTWIKDSPVPLPLVTSGNFGDSPEAALGQPTTQILFGNENINFGTFNGGRVSIGCWLDRSCEVGLEATLLLMEQRSSFFSDNNFANTDVVLTLPIQQPDGTETSIFALVTQDPSNLPSTMIGTAVSSQLWGAELNLVFPRWRCHSVSVEGLVGFRHLHLEEGLDIVVDLSRNATGGGSTNTLGHDQFSTKSNFYGGQLGLKLKRQCGKVTLEMVGKLALGGNSNRVHVDGSRTQIATDGSSTVTSGFVFAEPTNIGKHSESHFAVVPEGQIRLRYHATDYLNLLLGYQAFYWNDVVRPGNQIDHVVNTTQRGGGTLVGEPRPEPRTETSDFYMHAISFGAEVNF